MVFSLLHNLLDLGANNLHVLISHLQPIDQSIKKEINDAKNLVRGIKIEITGGRSLVLTAMFTLNRCVKNHI